jgi:ribosome-associated protein
VSSEELTRRVAEVAEEKGGSDVVALDVRTLVGYTDFLVICSARNERQAKAIQDEVYARMKADDDRVPARVEGPGDAQWVLLDYLDCVLHVFTPAARERYRLDTLWGEAKRLDVGTQDATA